MAISRPLLLVLIGAALLGATVFAVQGARSDNSASAPAAPVAAGQPASAKGQSAAQPSPEQALQSAFDFSGIKSGAFDASVSVDSRDEESGTVKASGSFQLGGPSDVPKLDLRLRVQGDGQDLDMGFVSTGDKAYMVQGDTGYQLPAAAWEQAKQARAQGAASPVPSLASIGLEPQRWVKGVKSEGAEQLDGVETRHLSASLDPAAAVRDLLKLAEQNGGAAVPSAAVPSLDADLVKRAELDVWVGKDDGLMRRIAADFEIDDATVKADVRLTEVNDPQSIEAPKRVSESLPAGLFGGVAPTFSTGLSLATGTDPGALELPTNNNPKRLARALDDHRKVLLFFHQDRGLDDKATAEAVREAARHSRALVLKDDVRNTKRYGDLVENLGVNQAPSIVIVDRRGEARLLEGYVDGRTLIQELADAR
jgi:hypothetical protein